MPTDELYKPIEDMPDLEYRFYPTNSRALPGANKEPTGLIQDTTYAAATQRASQQPAEELACREGPSLQYGKRIVRSVSTHIRGIKVVARCGGVAANGQRYLHTR